LRIFAALSVGVELNLFNARLPTRSRLRVPCSRLQLNFAESVHHNATPTTNTRRNGPQAAVTCSSKLITECVPASLLALAQQMWIQQSTVRFVDGSDGLLTGTSRAQKRVDFVHRLLSDGVRNHFTQQNTRFISHLDVIDSL
jgi:hypothetical protein